MANEIKNLESLLSSYLGPNKKVISSNISNLTAPGENYLSVVLKVEVVIRNEENGKEETLNAVAKCLHSGNNEMAKMFGKMNYDNEKNWYTEIVPTLENFLKDRGVKINFDFFPKLIGYRANLHGENDEIDEDSVILLENLAVNGKL